MTRAERSREKGGRDSVWWEKGCNQAFPLDTGGGYTVEKAGRRKQFKGIIIPSCTVQRTVKC